MWRCKSVLCQWVPVVRMVVLRSAVNDRPPVSRFPHRLHNTRYALQDNTTRPLLDATNYTHCQSSSAEKSSNRSKYKRWIFWDSSDSALLSSCKVDQTMLWNKFGFMLAFHIISETLVMLLQPSVVCCVCRESQTEIGEIPSVWVDLWSGSTCCPRPIGPPILPLARNWMEID